MVGDDDDSSELNDTTLGRGFMLWQSANGWQRAARSALNATGLTYVQVLLLAGLSKRQGDGEKVSQAALAQSLSADAMMTSQVLRALEAGGLVQRERDPGDTRARTLTLTEAGSQKLGEALPLLNAAEDAFFDPLGKKEERFVKTLRKLWRKRRHLGSTSEKEKAAGEMASSDDDRTPSPLVGVGRHQAGSRRARASSHKKS